MAVILHVVEAFGGGVFASVTQTCNGLARLGHEIHLAYSERPETPLPVSAYLDPRIVLHKVPMTRSIRPLHDLRGLLHLLRLFAKLRPQVIHLHSSKAGFLGRVAAALLGYSSRVFYSPHGLAFLQQDVTPQMRSLYRFLEWLGTRFGGCVVACSRSELQEVEACMRPHRTALVENAIDTAVAVPKSASSEAKCRIGTAGRIAPPRNPEMFRQIAAEIAGPGVEFVWIGGGDEAAANRLKEAGVAVTGWLKREQALQELAKLDIYVQTSLWEGMPVAVIEALAAGIPAVVTDVVGNRDAVEHGRTGFVARNKQEMIGYLRRLIAEPSLRQMMGQEARELALRRFSLERMLTELVALYGLQASGCSETIQPVPSTCLREKSRR